MRRWLLWSSAAALAVAAVLAFFLRPWTARPPAGADFAGTQSCRPCHENFYHLWSTSHHGLAMQPVTAELVRKELTAPPHEIPVGDSRYLPVLTPGGARVEEVSPRGTRGYRMVYAMGGKNVYYFLTPLERGRLQVLPVAYDVRRNGWFDTSASGMRHFADIHEQRVGWRDPLYTFNTSCYGCHVSQLSTNYDLDTDTYHTRWTEPGINCETCHGPSAAHVRACLAMPKGQKPADLKIIVTRTFTPDQHIASCSSCHAKASVLTDNYRPGDRFFDYFDLVTLESPDYYPDGRDLGENYTYTGWLMNRCAASSKLHCVICHTSSGRYRFPGGKADQACLPCHEQRVKNPAPHTHHKPESAGSRCVSCHMPKTDFANMQRSDHSFRPPTPAATIEFKSPNACNLCHTDRDAAWSDREVRKWHKDNYQEKTLRIARLVDAARKRQWQQLPAMLAYIAEPKRDVVFATSLIRLMAAAPDGRQWPVLLAALKDPSPLIRSAAAAGLEGHPIPGVRDALLGAIRDDSRLVRLRAMGALAVYSVEQLPAEDRPAFASALAELESSFRARQDDWSNHYNLGNLYSRRQQYQQAVSSYQIASRLRPDEVLPLVNASIAYANLGQTEPAAQMLEKALAIDPENAAANFNLGLLKAEQGDVRRAEEFLRAALRKDPAMAAAAYNLAVILSKDRMPEAVEWCRKACDASPAEPKYAYTLAFYLNQSGKPEAAARLLSDVIALRTGYIDAYVLLGSIYESQGERERAGAVYRRALNLGDITPQDRQMLTVKLAALAPDKHR